MKPSILIIALTLISVSLFGQSKKDTLKKTVKPAQVKVEYHADPNKVYDIKLSLTYDEISAFATSESDLDNSEKISAKQATASKEFKKDVTKDITKLMIRQMNAEANADYLKFQTDTAKRSKGGGIK